MYPFGMYDGYGLGYGLGYGFGVGAPPVAIPSPPELRSEGHTDAFVSHHDESGLNPTVALLSFTAISALGGLLLARKLNKTDKIVDGVSKKWAEAARLRAEHITSEAAANAKKTADKVNSHVEKINDQIAADREAANQHLEDSVQKINEHFENARAEHEARVTADKEELAKRNARLEKREDRLDKREADFAAARSAAVSDPISSGSPVKSTTIKGQPEFVTREALEAETAKKAAEAAKAAVKLKVEGDKIFSDAMTALKSGKEQKGVELLLKAAEKGNIDAKVRVAEFRADGFEGVIERDPKKAFAEFQEITHSDPNNSRAWSGLGVSLFKGEATGKQNLPEAYECLKKAFELDPKNKLANFFLAKFHRDGLGGAEKSLDKAIAHFEQANQNVPEVLYDLGRCYENKADAIKLNGNAPGDVYANYKKAYEKYDRAGGRNPYALYYRGCLKAEGKGCTADLNKAIEWHKQALEQLVPLAKQGDEEAKKIVAELNAKFATYLATPSKVTKTQTILASNDLKNLLAESKTVVYTPVKPPVAPPIVKPAAAPPPVASADSGAGQMSVKIGDDGDTMLVTNGSASKIKPMPLKGDADNVVTPPKQPVTPPPVAADAGAKSGSPDLKGKPDTKTVLNPDAHKGVGDQTLVTQPSTEDVKLSQRDTSPEGAKSAADTNNGNGSLYEDGLKALEQNNPIGAQLCFENAIEMGDAKAFSPLTRSYNAILRSEAYKSGSAESKAKTVQEIVDFIIRNAKEGKGEVKTVLSNQLRVMSEKAVEGTIFFPHKQAIDTAIKEIYGIK